MTATTLAFTELNGPCGRLLLAGDDEAVRVLWFMDGKRTVEPAKEWVRDEAPLRHAAEELRAYFAGELREFSVRTRPEGTPFQVRVWRELERIPYGETISYGRLAQRVGNPNASRAVGLANGQNPISIIIPCHRVIGANGKLTGYGGGLPLKEKLLALERRQQILL